MRIYLLSGAGLSAPSGIPTYRDSGGIWDRYSIERYATAEALKERPSEVIAFFDERRKELARYKPNEAHRFFAKLNCIHLTQNVDDLCERAGDEPIHLHGKLTEIRCEACKRVWDIGYEAQPKKCPYCRQEAVRPNVVLFGEVAPNYRYLYTTKADIFIAVGTSGMVLDIADIAMHYPTSILIDPKRHKRQTIFGEFDTYLDSYFTYFINTDVIEALGPLQKLLKELGC